MTTPVLERPVGFMNARSEQFGYELPSYPGDGIGGYGDDAISRLLQPPTPQGLMNGFGTAFRWLIPGGDSVMRLFQTMQQLFRNRPDEHYFQNASGGSVGDPHLSFNGTTWDNMGSQPDLLHSDSFAGGYRLSTQTTPPSPGGVTYNQSATVSTNYDTTHITMDKDGNVTIAQYGNSFPLQAGQSVDLESGQFVARNADGSLQITCANGSGAEITTMMRSNGTGVDVTTTANNVDLGGALVNENRTATPLPHPRHRIAF